MLEIQRTRPVAAADVDLGDRHGGADVSTPGRPTADIMQRLMATAAAIVAAALVFAGVHAIAADEADRPKPPAIADTLVSDEGAPISADGLEPEVAGSLRDFVSEKHKNDFDALMADPEDRSEFFVSFQDGLDSSSGGQAKGTVQNVLAYGYDNGIWITASYADMARGLIWVAVNYCKRYVPAWACNAAGNWLTSMARGYAPANDHGIWGKVTWRGYTGGRW